MSNRTRFEQISMRAVAVLVPAGALFAFVGLILQILYDSWTVLLVAAALGFLATFIIILNMAVDTWEDI